MTILSTNEEKTESVIFKHKIRTLMRNFNKNQTQPKEALSY